MKIAAMTAYEIRLIRDGEECLVYSASVMGDHAAIRRAHNLAQDGDFIEVWRGLHCVYTTREQSVLAH